MTAPLAPLSPVAGAPGAADRPSSLDAARLAKAARALEGVFVQQLYKAMRETVPAGGLGRGGAGEETFTSLMDQHIAEQTPGQWKHGLAGAIARVLTRAAGGSDAPAAAEPLP